jgi:hypothetical protein
MQYIWIKNSCMAPYINAEIQIIFAYRATLFFPRTVARHFRSGRLTYKVSTHEEQGTWEFGGSRSGVAVGSVLLAYDGASQRNRTPIFWGTVASFLSRVRMSQKNWKFQPLKMRTLRCLATVRFSRVELSKSNWTFRCLKMESNTLPRNIGIWLHSDIASHSRKTLSSSTCLLNVMRAHEPKENV